MTLKNNQIKTLSTIIFTLGIMIGAFIGALNTLADTEATFFGFTKVTNHTLDNLSCPTFITTEDTGYVSLHYKNDTDRDLNIRTRTEISGEGVFRAYQDELTLQPGEEGSLQWAIDANDMVFGRFIFVRVFQFPVYPFSMAEKVCGISVLNLPGTGQQVFWYLNGIALFLSLAGLYTWKASRTPLDEKQQHFYQAMRFMLLLVIAVIVVSTLGNWVFGIFLLAATVLMLGGILYITTRN